MDSPPQELPLECHVDALLLHFHNNLTTLPPYLHSLPLEGRVDGRAVQTLTASVQFNVIWGMYVFPPMWPQDGR